MTDERRKGEERRKSKDRRLTKKKGLLRTIGIAEKRGKMDRRAGLDRRDGLSSHYRKEALIQITEKSMIKRWDSAKGKMTYLWDTGLKAITFAQFQKDKVVEVVFHTDQGKLVVPGRILRVKKVFTEHGFATEMDIQFEEMNEQRRSRINQMIWGD